jgi:hypothetical protein
VNLDQVSTPLCHNFHLHIIMKWQFISHCSGNLVTSFELCIYKISCPSIINSNYSYASGFKKMMNLLKDNYLGYMLDEICI